MVVQVCCAVFSDTAHSQPSCTLSAYFSNPQVEQYLQEDERQRATITSKLAGMYGTVQTRLQSMTSTTQVPQLLRTHVYTRSPAVNDTRLPAWLPHQAVVCWQAFCHMASICRAAVNNSILGIPAQLATGSAMAAGALVLVVAISGRPTVLAQLPSTTATIVDRRNATVNTLSQSEADRLVHTWQHVKSSALGSDWDTEQMKTILAGPALAQYSRKVQHYKDTGYFFRYKLHKCQITSMQSASNSTVVGATIREAAVMYSIDGRLADKYESEYDVQYHMQSCSDGQWRICEIKVLGKSPA